MRKDGWLNASKRNGACPLCDYLDWCSFSKDQQAVLCRRTEIAPPGWHLTKAATDGIGFVFVVKQESTKQNLEQWKREREIQRQQREREERQKRAKSLSLVERDHQFRKLLDQLSLSLIDKADLQRRGLTDEEIKLSNFKSVETWQKLDFELDHRLPGVNLDGRSLLIKPGDEGYLCPIKNAEGLIIGCQLRRRAQDDSGRYRWLTSVTRKRPNGASSHLPNGELPITIHRPSILKSKVIALVEGTGVKPFVTAQRRGQVVIGAASANFAASPEQFKEQLNKVSIELNTKEIVLYADSGAITNRHVMQQYRTTYQLATKLGFHVLIGWWEQYTKNDPDIDELPADAQIELITFAKFEVLAKTPTPIESISGLFKRFKNKLNSSFKGFGKQRVKPVIKPKPEEIKINIPTPEDYAELGYPHIIYDGAILDTWQQAKTLGYKVVLDGSATGIGKSHAAGNANPSAFGVVKIFYLAADHRNPTTLSVEENFGDISPRHNGFKLDATRVTPLGLPFEVHPKKDEKPDTPGNCFRTPLFHNLAGKNLSGIEQSDESPVCDTCHLSGACQSGIGEGSGFRFQRREAFKNNDRLRAHPDSMPNTEESEYHQWMGIWDEAGRLIKSTKLLEVKLAEFDKTWAELEAKLPEHHQTLTELRRSLRQFLTGELKQPYHGWSDTEIKAALPLAPDNALLIASEIEAALRPNLFELLKEPDSVDFRGNTGKGVSKATRNLIRQTLRKEAYTESTKNLDSVLLNWLPQFLRIWGGEKGAFRCQWGNLTIASRDEKHANIVKAFSFNVFLDATVDPDVLALRLGIPRHELLVIEKKKPTYQNLRIVQVNGFGKLGKNRSDSIEERVQLFQAWLRQKHSDIDFIDWLNFSDFAHFREGRGSNQFINHSTLASFGIPYQNIGALQMEWQTLTGKSPEGEEFQAFVDAHVQEEIIQEVGRLRSHLSPEQQKTFYFVGDYDLSFLANELPGAGIESQDIINLCPEAAGGVEKTKWIILQGLKQVVESTAKVSIDAVAAAAGVSQPCISKIAKPFGGWKKLEKILRVLLDKLYSVGNIFSKPELELMNKPESELSDSEYATLKDLEAVKFMATEYLPLCFDDPEVDVPDEVNMVVESFGWKAFEQIVGLMPIQSKAKLLGTLINMFPSEILEELRAITFDGLELEVVR